MCTYKTRLRTSWVWEEKKKPEFNLRSITPVSWWNVFQSVVDVTFPSMFLCFRLSVCFSLSSAHTLTDPEEVPEDLFFIRRHLIAKLMKDKCESGTRVATQFVPCGQRASDVSDIVFHFCSSLFILSFPVFLFYTPLTCLPFLPCFSFATHKDLSPKGLFSRVFRPCVLLLFGWVGICRLVLQQDDKVSQLLVPRWLASCSC